jgi:hypothetical protein
MGSLSPNQYVDALAKTVLSFASFHLLLLAFQAASGKPDALNVFAILGLDSWAPGLGKGPLNFALSYVLVLGIYALVFRFFTRGRGRHPKA